MTMYQLLQRKAELENDILIGIDTEDTWYDLGAVKFLIKLTKG